MKNKKSLKLLIFVVSLSLFWVSCIKDSFDFKKLGKSPWNPNLAVPLAHSTFTIYDIIKNVDRDSNIIVDNNNFCTLVYRDRLFSLRADEIIQIPDQAFNYSLQLTPVEILTLTNTNTVTTVHSQTVSYASGSTQIDSINYKNLTLSVFHASGYPHGGTLVVDIPGAKKNGVSFSGTISLTPNSSGTTNFDLSGYTFDMTLNGMTTNQFQIFYTVTFNNSGNPTPSSAVMNIQSAFNNNQFKLVYGYIGTQQITPDEDTVNVKIFKNSLGTGSFRLVDPYLEITFNNSFGIPIRSNFIFLKGYNPISNQIFDISSSPGIPNPLPINVPASIGQTASSGFVLNNANTSGFMSDMINEQPKYVIYKLNSLTNIPAPTNRNWVLDESRFTVDMNLYLPLHGRAWDFMFQDTLDFQLDRINEIDNILFRTYINNGFPIDILVQVYFVSQTGDTINPTYNILDSLIVPNQLFMRSAQIDVNTGKVTAPTEKTTDVYADRAKLARITGANKLFIRAFGASTNNGNTNVKIYSDYKLTVKIGVQTQLNTQF